MPKPIGPDGHAIRTEQKANLVINYANFFEGCEGYKNRQKQPNCGVISQLSSQWHRRRHIM